MAKIQSVLLKQLANTLKFQFIFCQVVSVFFICLSNRNAASHTCAVSPHTQTCLLPKKKKYPPFFPLTPNDFLQISSFSNNAESPITCVIVIDAFDCVKLHHPQRCNSLKATDLLHVRRNPKTARTAASVVHQTRQRREQTKSPLRPAATPKKCLVKTFSVS